MKKITRVLSLMVMILSISSTSYTQEVLYVAANSGLTLRKSPSTSGEKIDLLPWGTQVTPQRLEYATDRVWAWVSANGKNGYVAMDYLTPIILPKTAVSIKQWVQSQPGAIERSTSYHAFDSDDPTAMRDVTTTITSTGLVLTEYSEFGRYTLSLLLPEVTTEVAKFIIQHLEPMQAYQSKPHEQYVNASGMRGVYYIFTESMD